MRRTLVRTNAVGTWDVVDAAAPQDRLFRGDRPAAEAWARELCAGEGGSVSVEGPDGTVLAQLEVEAAAASPAQLPDLDTLLVKGTGLAVGAAARAGVPGAATVKSQGRHVNLTLTAVQALGLVSTSALSAEVFSLGASWAGVFFATLTWSLGVAVITYLVRSGALVGAQTVPFAALAFVGAGAVAKYVGTGTMAIPPYTGGPVAALQAYAAAAVSTYGLLGALLSGGIGAWLGYTLATSSTD